MQPILASRTLRLALGLALLAAPATAGVLVVGGGGPGTYPDIQSAVAASVDGDVVLVQSGSYGPVSVDGKALTITADAGATVQIAGRTTVQNVPAGKTVVIAGIDGQGVAAAGVDPALGVGLLVRGNAGYVRIQDGAFTGANGLGDGLYVPPGSSCCNNPGNRTGGWAGARVEDNAGSVVLRRVVLTGGRGRNANFQCYDCGTDEAGGDGLDLLGSLAAVYESACTGGRGEQNGHRGGLGGAGIRLTAGAFPAGLFVSGTVAHGGTGGDGTDFVGAPGGDGGPGLHVGAGTSAQTVEILTAGGAGGLDQIGQTLHGAPGAPTSGPGAVFPFAVTRLTLEAPNVARVGQPLPITVRGQPGESAYLFLSRSTVFVPRPSWRGVLLTDPGSPPRSRVLGPIPASGVLDVTLAVPPLEAAIAGRTGFLQTWKLEPLGGSTLGEPAAVTVLAPGL